MPRPLAVDPLRLRRRDKAQPQRPGPMAVTSDHMPRRPRLTFACELPPAKLTELLGDETVIRALAAMGARVSLALMDLSAERAAAARRLAETGVPVAAWLLLPREDGYFFNLDNPEAAAARYDEFLEWTRAHALSWDALTLDVEPSLEDMRRLFSAQERTAAVVDMIRRASERRRLERGSEAYAGLVARMRADGYRVESAHFPFLLDDRRARSTLVHRVLGVPQVRVDREVFMLYTSLQGALGPVVLSSTATRPRPSPSAAPEAAPRDSPAASLLVRWDGRSWPAIFASPGVSPMTSGFTALRGAWTRGCFCSWRPSSGTAANQSRACR